MYHPLNGNVRNPIGAMLAVFFSWVCCSECRSDGSLCVETTRITIEDSDKPFRLKLDELLVPGVQYSIPVDITSAIEETIDLTSINTSCGCVVARSTQSRILPGESALLELTLRTSSTDLGNISRVVSFKLSSGHVLALQISAEVHPFVSVAHLGPKKGSTELIEATFTMSRPGWGPDDFDFQPPASSVFDWRFESAQGQEAKFVLTPRIEDRSTQDNRSEWIEVCTFTPKRRSPIENVPLPITFSRPRKPSILPSQAVLDRDGLLKFFVVGDLDKYPVNVDVFVNGEKLQCTIQARSKRVFTVTASIGVGIGAQPLNLDEAHVMLTSQNSTAEVVLPIRKSDF